MRKQIMRGLRRCAFAIFRTQFTSYAGIRSLHPWAGAYLWHGHVIARKHVSGKLVFD